MAQLPPFCPNLACGNHVRPEGQDWYQPFGWYQTKAHGRVKRYACRRCGKSFSEQTFRLSYYLHLNIDFKDLLYRLSACSGIRAMARAYQVTDKVIANRVGRLARQAIGVMAGLRCSQDCDEALVAYGFESYICSQDNPITVHHLIGQASQYIHACDLAHSQMSIIQKPKRKLLEPGEIYASFERICHTIDDLTERRGSIVLHTDEKKEYRAVLEANQYLDGKVTHITTSSQQAMTDHHPLWAATYYNRELRKDQATLVRETTRWSQDASNCMERMYAYAGYHNFFKPFRIKQRDNRTHAEMAGFDVERIESLLKTIFTKRFFYSKVSFTVGEWLVWLRAYRTPFRADSHYLPGYVTGKERLGAWPRAA
jgi:hypothetical protein